MTTMHEPHGLFQAIAPHVTPVDPHAPILDLEKSRGARFWDDRIGRAVIDFASHYASLPLGYNHPDFFDPEYEKRLLDAARIKVANLDMLTETYAYCLETFLRVVQPEGFEKVFFVEGGALAVENAMKIAFDWKHHRNMRLGRGERGTQVLHFRQAFHGRSGYTLSVTNTADPNKIKFFPKFDWPRVLNPKMRFPMTGANLEETLEDERAAQGEIERILAAKAVDIAAILVEPIQGEGGDNHFRPEFLRFLRDAADAHDVLLVFDEVQTGMGMTGTPWAFQGLGVEPDVFAFAKKAQTGGCFAGTRVMEEEHNCFTVPSRISSTWGGGLVDMVRCARYLEICERDDLFRHAARMGDLIIERLHGIADRTEMISNVRGRGLFIAFDLEYPETRGPLVERLHNDGLHVLTCGLQSVRFRPHLNVTEDVIDEALAILEAALEAVEPPVTSSI